MSGLELLLANIITSTIKSKFEKPGKTGKKSTAAAKFVAAPVTLGLGAAATTEAGITGDPVYDWLMVGAGMAVTYSLSQFRDWSKDKFKLD